MAAKIKIQMARKKSALRIELSAPPSLVHTESMLATHIALQRREAVGGGYVLSMSCSVFTFFTNPARRKGR